MESHFNQSEMNLFNTWDNDDFSGTPDEIQKLKDHIFELMCQLAPLVNWKELIIPMRISVNHWRWPICFNIHAPDKSIYRIDIDHENNITYICRIHEKLGKEDPLFKTFKNDLVKNPINVDNYKFEGIPPNNYTIYALENSRITYYSGDVYNESGVINSEYPIDEDDVEQRNVPINVACLDNDTTDEKKQITLANHKEFSKDKSLMLVRSDKLNDDECVVLGCNYNYYIPDISAYLFDTKNKVCYYEHVKIDWPKKCSVESEIIKMYQDGDKIRYLYEDCIVQPVEEPIYTKQTYRDTCSCESEFEECEFSVSDLIDELHNIEKSVK
jgi:hypothetical protein